MLSKKLILAIILSLNSIINLGQANYYVSYTGSDSNPGTLSMPWKTIQYALNQLSTNDTLNILNGTYNEKITIPSSNLYIRNYLNHTPIIDATGITTQNAIISINNKSNIVISGLELKNNIQNDAQGILIEGVCTNITIKNCKIHDIHFSSNINDPVNPNTNAQGIIVYGSHPITPITNLKIQNNQLYNCRLGYSEGIAVNGNVDGFEITGNTVHNLTNIGIDIIGHEGTSPNPANNQARNGLIKNNIVHNCRSAYATSAGIYIDGGKNIIVENNTLYKNGYGIEIGCENIGKTTDSIFIRDNIIYNNENAAIALGGFDYPNNSGKVINSSIRNNTCYYNDYSNSGNGELYLSYSENCIIENNIFYTNDQNILCYAELTQPSLVFNYNTIYCPSGANALTVNWNGNTLTGYSVFVMNSSTNSNSTFADPEFISADTTTPNFHIKPTSPCINSGNPSFSPPITETDMDGELRANGIIDCGADEYYSTTGLIENTTTQYLLYPNPFYNHTTLHTNNPLINATLTIYNQYGKPVKQIKNISGNTFTLHREYLPCGLYLLHLIENNQIIITKKILITEQH